MSSDAPPATTGPVVLRVKLRYPDVATFIDKFAINVGRVGMFLPSRALQPVGTEVRYELRLADDQAVLSGVGRVASVVEPSEEAPGRVPGMAIEFLRMTPQSRDLVMRVLEYRRERGLGEPALPAPEASISEAASRDSSELLGAPRGAAPSRLGAAAIAPLPDEPPRPARRSLAELVAASPAPAAGPDPLLALSLDDGGVVDLDHTRTRVRALVAQTSDDELAALLRAPAPPPADVAAASEALARSLGAAAPPPRHAGAARGSEPPLDRTGTNHLPHQAASPTAAPSPSPPAAAPAPAALAEAELSRAALAPDENAAAAQRRARVTRPPSLSRPANVFARTRASAPTAAPPIDEEPAASAPSAVAVEAGAPPPSSAFERVLAELEEAELTGSSTPPAQLAASAPGATHAPRGDAPALNAGIAIDDLDDSLELGGPTQIPAPSDDMQRAAPVELDLGDLGESAFEILDEEEVEERAITAPRAAVQRPFTNDGADVGDVPSASSSGSSIPTWRRTAGFDPLEGAAALEPLAELAPPTIPGRIPTREIDLESALAALDLAADDLPTPASRAAPRREDAPAAFAPAPTPTTASDASRASDASASNSDDPASDDIPLELEFDD